jgi:hypothetical protein
LQNALYGLLVMTGGSPVRGSGIPQRIVVPFLGVRT